jgi:restriction system protein
MGERLQERFEGWPWWAMIPASFGTFGLIAYGGAALCGWQLWWLTAAVGFCSAWLVTLIGCNAIKTVRDRRMLLSNQDVLEGFGRITWRQFEQLIAAWYERDGFEVDKRGGARRDGGIDLIAQKPERTLIVQCKHWKVEEIQVDEVQRMAGIVAGWQRNHRGAVQGVVVCSWLFAEAAVSFARDVNVELVNGDELVRRLRSIATTAYADEVSPPSCNRCAHPMVRRVNAQGRPFWGCSQYPRAGCKGTIDIRET